MKYVLVCIIVVLGLNLKSSEFIKPYEIKILNDSTDFKLYPRKSIKSQSDTLENHLELLNDLFIESMTTIDSIEVINYIEEK
jgi:hypothetical protein